MEDEVRRVIREAGVKFTDEEVESLVREITGLLHLFRQMDQLDLTQVEPATKFSREHLP